MRRIVLVAMGSLALAGGAMAATVPFDVSTGRPMVQLTVDGKGPYPFVLDTGAPGLIVSATLADQLGFETLGRRQVTSPLEGTPVDVRTVRVGRLDLAGAMVTDLDAIVLEQLGQADLGMGVVGPAVFRDHGPMRLDFAANMLTIGETARTSGNESWIPFGRSAPLLDVPVEIGELRLDGHIDTGSPGALAVPARFQDQLPLTGAVRTVGRARTIDAEFEIRAAPISESARVAGTNIALDEITLAELPVANVGTAALNGLVLFIDWEHSRFALTGVASPVVRRVMPGAAPSGGPPRFGVRATPGADGVINVVGTDPGSPAETIGLIAGDRIVAINGKPTTELEPAQVRAELATPGVVLTVERGGDAIRLPSED